MIFSSWNYKSLSIDIAIENTEYIAKLD